MDLIIVSDEKGTWQKNFNVRLPFHFEASVCMDKGYIYELGLFDVRIFDTQEKVLTEAIYRLRIEERPTHAGLTSEQDLTLKEYIDLRNRLDESIRLLDLKIVDPSEISLDDLTKKVSECRKNCLTLGLQNIIV